MSTRHSSRRSKLIHISSAACWTVKTLLDAIAGCFYEWESEVYFGYYTGDIEAGGVSDVGFVDGFEMSVRPTVAARGVREEAEVRLRRERIVVDLKCILRAGFWLFVVCLWL